MTLRLLPRSLAGRTALVLLLALAVVQGGGLAIHGLDRVDALRLAQIRDVAVRAMSIYRTVALADRDNRAAVLRAIDAREGTVVKLADSPPVSALAPAYPELQRALRVNMLLVPMRPAERPHELIVLGGPAARRSTARMRASSSRGLNGLPT